MLYVVYYLENAKTKEQLRLFSVAENSVVICHINISIKLICFIEEWLTMITGSLVLSNRTCFEEIIYNITLKMEQK